MDILPVCSNITCSVPNCYKCINSTCDVCNIGFILASNQSLCLKNTCASPCTLCDSSGNCLSCSDPYSYFNKTSSKCVSGCLLPNCQKCRFGSSTCESCSPGFALYLWRDTCLKTPINNCIKIYDWKNQEFRCRECAVGYRPSADQILCIASSCSSILNCVTCSLSACTQCRAGFSPNANGSVCVVNLCSVAHCLYCDSMGNCLHCDSYSTGTSTCIPTICSIPHCNKCKINSIYCDECSTGFALNIWNNNCESTPINNCLEQTISSSNEIFCVTCAPNYELSTDALSCIAICTPNCANCNQNGVCSACISGYSLNSNACVKNVCSISGC